MKTNASTPNYQVTKETITVFKNIVLDGVKTLKADRVTTTFEVKYELHRKSNQVFKIVSKNQTDEVVEPMSFDLIEVTTKDLARYRKNKVPSFVLKVDGKLYHSIIPDNIVFVSSTILGAHLCASIRNECNRLSAASDEQGGCEKVRDRCNCIEKYPWITTGYETFGTKHNSFVVVKCEHYEKSPQRDEISDRDNNYAKLKLEQFL